MSRSSGSDPKVSVPGAFGTRPKLPRWAIRAMELAGMPRLTVSPAKNLRFGDLPIAEQRRILRKRTRTSRRRRA